MSDEQIEETEGEPQPRTLKTLARDHAGLLIAGGVVAGAALAYVLTPKSTRRMMAQRTIAAASAAGEAGRRLGRQGAQRLEGLGESIGEGAGAVKQRAARAAEGARSTGLDLIQTAASLISALRR